MCDEESSRPLVLIEPYASALSGHWTKALILLAREAARQRRTCLIVAPNGVHEMLAEELIENGCVIVQDAGGRMCSAGLLISAGSGLTNVHNALVRRYPDRAVTYQFLHFARALKEAAAVRLASRVTAHPSPMVLILTANETLHAFSASLSGRPHLRYIHEARCHEGRAIRLAERFGARGLSLTHAFCPTAGVALAVNAREPGLKTTVMPFGLAGEVDYISESERAGAAASLGIGSGTPIASLVGGWWASKDMATVADAVHRLRTPMRLLVAGQPLDDRLLDRMRAAENVELIIRHEQLSAGLMRAVYGASSFTIVSRHPDGCESGVLLDAGAYGVPVVTSDHDPELATKLRGQSWARVFHAGDPESLAEALEWVCREALTRPSPSTSRELGMLTPGEMLRRLDQEMTCRERKPG